MCHNHRFNGYCLTLFDDPDNRKVCIDCQELRRVRIKLGKLCVNCTETSRCLRSERCREAKMSEDLRNEVLEIRKRLDKIAGLLEDKPKPKFELPEIGIFRFKHRDGNSYKLFVWGNNTYLPISSSGTIQIQKYPRDTVLSYIAAGVWTDFQDIK